MNKDKSTTYQKFWDTAKAVINGKYIALSALLKKKIVDSNQCFKFPPEKLEKEEKINSKANRIKKMLKDKSRNQ